MSKSPNPTQLVHPMTPLNLDGDYKAIAASQTNSQLGAVGALSDTLSGLVIVPATTSPGAISITDGVATITVFAGGTTSVTDLKPFPVFFGTGIYALGPGGWKVTTGANVSVVAFGKFS